MKSVMGKNMFKVEPKADIKIVFGKVNCKAFTKFCKSSSITCFGLSVSNGLIFADMEKTQ